MSDRDILIDAREHQRFMTNAYNACANECVNKNLHDELINILNQEHTLGADIISELEKRGWSNEQKASYQEIEMAKKAFKGKK
ncbi:MAG: spore coat protein [Oscillospiraceae bacterium]|nr:spore coat protein [Oscillospiraceae bacterium]